MLDNLRQIAIFARTVEHGSFRRAADALRLSPSVVSHHVAQLEQSLGVALLYRSTRRITVTADGARLFEAAQQMLIAAESGLEAISAASETPSGELRITLPAFLAHSALLDRIAAFSLLFPKVRLVLDFTDDRRHLLRDGFDLAIRAGWLEDSQLVARKLGDVERRLIASVEYCSARRAPVEPEDLMEWDWLLLAPVRPEVQVTSSDGEVRRLKPSSRVIVNSAQAMYQLVGAGVGLAVLPANLCDDGVKAGSIRHVLPAWTLAPIGTYAVWPANAPRQGLTRRVVDFLADRDPVH